MTKAARSKKKPEIPAPAPAPAWERARWLAVATLSGTLWFLACASFDIVPLAWFASVPALFAVERASTTRRAVLFGWFSGLVANAGGFYWITNLLERFGHMPWPLAVLLFLLLCAYQALVFALWAWATRRIRQEFPKLPMVLVAPVTMVTFELVVPFIFPWYLAITQAWQPHVIQVADLAGPLGVTALLLVSSGAIYDVITRRRAALVPAAAGAAVIAAALVYGHIRIGQMDALIAAAPKIKVGLVQGNVPFNEKAQSHPQFANTQLAALQEQSQLLEQAGADLIVWTETSFPYAIPRDTDADDPPVVRAPIKRGENGRIIRQEPTFTTPLIFGAVTVDVPRNDDVSPHNTALMLDRDGRYTGRFDKMFLMMFSESIPGVHKLPWLRKILPRTAGNFERGAGVVTFPFTTKDGASYRLGPMICYEDIVPLFGREIGALHPHLLVNITNDAWFGDTSEPWEHLALSVYRSVEVRSELVRAVNTGVSAHVNLAGRVREKSYAVNPLKTPRPADRLMTEVAMVEGGHTVYAAVGDLFGYLCSAATFLLWLVIPRVRRRLRRRHQA